MSPELMQRQFEPINAEGFNPIKRGGDLLFYEYHPENIPSDVPQDFIVAKTPRRRDQYFMGRREAVLSNAIAFNILDSLGLNELRVMSVITYPYDYADSGVVEKPDWNIFIKDLMNRFGLTKKNSQSKFDHKSINIGVIPDIQSPVFIGYDHPKWAKLWGVEDINFSAIFDAVVFAHEWQHVLQFREGLPINSLWAERNAMSYEGELLLRILNMNKFKKRQQSIIAYCLQHKSVQISNYRNGIGFRDHLTSDAYNSDGSPQKKHNLGNNDFEFGY